MVSKFYLFDNRQDAQALLDVLSAAWGEDIPYTEVRESNNNKGFAVKADKFTKQISDVELQYLPSNFYNQE